ncbi:MAG TPA: glutathione peroxidase [Candidatus Babeliales bacterium]|jgi:glutathione peroxidase|nr:glutathione peroxidase [Candidatus Babeliales bacterium]
MNNIRLLSILAFCIILGIGLSTTMQGKSRRKKDLDQTAYTFSFTTIDGKPLHLSDYKGKVLLIVNTASFCKFTPQYKELEELYQRYKKDGLVVIAVPSNDFGKQEPGSSEEISCFIHEHYPVTFLVTEKEIVKGKNAHPFYIWAGKKAGFWGKPKWNFHKYIIDRNGHFSDWFSSNTLPLSPMFINAIEKALEMQ